MNSKERDRGLKRKWFSRRRNKGLGLRVTRRTDIPDASDRDVAENVPARPAPPPDSPVLSVASEPAPVTDEAVPDGAEPVVEYEERRATTGGPQLFCILIDNSISMEEGTKAAEATRVLADFMAYASQQNGLDGTGRKTYIYSQVVLFAEEIQDITNGLTRPPARLQPEEHWTIRHPSCPDRLGNTTDYQGALDHVCRTLAGPNGMTPERLESAMPAPLVLLITDGKPTRPLPESHAREAARKAAARIRSLALPGASRRNPTLEWLAYGPTTAKLVAIGLGTGEELDSGFLEELASVGEWNGESFPLYLHCPDVAQLRSLGTRIVGTMTRAEQRAGRRLEEVVYSVRQGGQR